MEKQEQFFSEKKNLRWKQDFQEWKDLSKRKGMSNPYFF